MTDKDIIDAYERDRDSAASVTEPCYCGKVASEYCPHCETFMCEACAFQHDAFWAQQGRPL